MEIIATLPFLQSFVQVVEEESFALAAKKMKISTSAISKQINKLEEILGLQLLVRTTRTMVLTPPGILFYDQCKNILMKVEEAQDAIGELHAEPQGRLNVVSARYFAKQFLNPHIDAFLDKYPAIYLNLEWAERVPDMEKEEVDVLIGMSLQPESTNIIQKKLMSTRYVFTASPSYLKKYGTPKTPIELLEHRYLAHSMRKQNASLLFSNHSPVQIKPFLQVNDAETLLNFAIKGMGIMKTHEYVVSEAIDLGLLIEILNPFSQEEVPIYVAYPQRRILSRKIRCFIDFVQERLPKEKKWKNAFFKDEHKNSFEEEK